MSPTNTGTFPNPKLLTTTWAIPLAATIFGMMAIQMSSLGFSPLLPAIQKEFGISYSQVGLFTGMYGLIAIAVSLPAGLLAKRFGEKRVMLTGICGAAIGLLCLSQAPDYHWGLVSRGVWLVGYRMAFVGVFTAMAMTAPPEYRSRAMGTLGAMSSLASVIGAPFGTLLARPYGWRGGMIGFACIALLGAAVFGIFYRRQSTETARVVAGPHSAGDGSGMGSVFRNPIVWGMVLLGLINMGGFSATFFVPYAVKTQFGLGPMDAALVISSSYVAAIFLNLLFGYLCDRYDRWKMMIALALVLIPSCFAMMIPNLLAFRIATALVVSLGLCATNQIYAIAGAVLEGKNTGPGIGIASLGGGVFGYLGPQMLGFLRDRTGGFTAGWFFVAAGVVVALIEILVLRSYSQRRAAQSV